MFLERKENSVFDSDDLDDFFSIKCIYISF